MNKVYLINKYERGVRSNPVYTWAAIRRCINSIAARKTVKFKNYTQTLAVTARGVIKSHWVSGNGWRISTPMSDFIEQFKQIYQGKYNRYPSFHVLCKDFSKKHNERVNDTRQILRMGFRWSAMDEPP